MLDRARKVLLGIPARVVYGLVLLYLAFAWFGFEPLVKWALPKAVADQSGYQLTLERARFNPFFLSVELQGLALKEPTGKPLLNLAQLRVNFDTFSLFRRAYVFDELRLTEPVVQVELRPGGRLNWLDFADALSGPPEPKTDSGAAPARMLLKRCIVERGRVELTDTQVAGGFRTQVNPLDLELEHLSTLPEDLGEHTLSARLGIGATIKWKGTLGLNPVVAQGELAVDELMLDRLWPYLKDSVNMAPPQGKVAMKLAYRASYAARVLDLQLDQVEAGVDALVLRGSQDAEPSVALDAVRLRGGRFNLAQREFSLDDFQVAGGRVAVAFDDEGQLNLARWMKPTAPVAPASAPAVPSNPKTDWRFTLGHGGVDKLALQLVDARFAAPLTADIAQFKLDFKGQGQVGPAAPALSLQSIGAEVSGLRLSSAGMAQPWFELATVSLAEGRVALPANDITLGQLTLAGGRLAVRRTANGELPLVQALARQATPPPPAPAASQPTLRYRVDKIEASDFALAWHDESVQPAATVSIEALAASAAAFSSDPKAEVPVKLQFRVRQGGRFEASGKLTPAAPAADLQLKLADLSFKPAQPYVSQSTNVVLAGGQASTQGRLRYQSGKLRYDGGFAVTDLLLNEASSGERFLGWKSLTAPKLSLTPEQLSVADLALDGVDAKFVIFQDRSINVARLLKPGSPLAGPAAAASAAAALPERKAPSAFQVEVQQVRITNGKTDFSDLSLALPFGARIHALNGQINGLSSQPGAAAQVELGGQVDDYGLARVAGQINPFDPTGNTDLKLVFRNVEMTSLTPYSATFAGRKIRSGKLSLDLEYKIKNRQLEGNNLVVMDKVTLGERVESPTATQLPLDLALAILQDSDGKINLGLPVSGSLDDPQFSYGQLIWKAFTNVLAKVVTSPFRALGAMLGINGDKLDKVAFDAGRTELQPPEREKLTQVAALLAKRPGLVLQVHGDYNPRADHEAIREWRLRRAVAKQAGRTLGPDEDPGPISSSEPATRTALQKLYRQRFGIDALAALSRSAKPAASAPVEADLHQLMVRSLLEAEVVDEALLRALGAQRAEAIRRELLAQQVASERIRLAEPQAQQAEGSTALAALGIDAPPPAAAASAP